MTTDQQKALNYIGQVSRLKYTMPEGINIKNVKSSTLFLFYKALCLSKGWFDSGLRNIVEELSIRDR